MKKISDIYAEYKSMRFICEHMLRVAGVAMLICDAIDIPLDKNKIISACLLHDMGNLIKADLNYFPEALEPEGLLYWQQVKADYIAKYGTDDHEGNTKIIEELGLHDILHLVNSFGFVKYKDNLGTDDYAKKICFYADQRVTPHGVVSVRERMSESRERYVGRKHDLIELGDSVVEDAVIQIEEQIFSHCKIKPEDINDATVAPIVSKLKDFVIK